MANEQVRVGRRKHSNYVNRDGSAAETLENVIENSLRMCWKVYAKHEPEVDPHTYMENLTESFLSKVEKLTFLDHLGMRIIAREDFAVACKVCAELPELMRVNINMTAKLADAYRDSRTLLEYPIFSVIMVTAYAKAAGACTGQDVLNFWRINYSKLYVLIPGLSLTCDIPSLPTYIKILSLAYAKDRPDSIYRYMIDAANIEVIMQCRYDNGILPNLKEIREVLYQLIPTYAIDGQALNGTFRPGSYDRSSKAGDVVQLYDCSRGVTLDLYMACFKNHERLTIPDLLRVTDSDDAVVMWDSINTTQATIEYVLEDGKHYLVPFKNNDVNKRIYTPTVNFFNDLIKGSIKNEDVGAVAYRTPEKIGHARQERSDFIFVPVDKAPPEIKELYPSATMVVCRRKETRPYISSFPRLQVDIDKRDKLLGQGKLDTSVTYQYYISNLEGPLAHIQSMVSINEYWLVETDHYVKDCMLRQDGMTAKDLDYIIANVEINNFVKTLLSFARYMNLRQKGGSRPSSYRNVMEVCSDPLRTACIMQELLMGTNLEGDWETAHERLNPTESIYKGRNARYETRKEPTSFDLEG